MIRETILGFRECRWTSSCGDLGEPFLATAPCRAPRDPSSMVLLEPHRGMPAHRLCLRNRLSRSVGPSLISFPPPLLMLMGVLLLPIPLMLLGSSGFRLLAFISRSLFVLLFRFFWVLNFNLLVWNLKNLGFSDLVVVLKTAFLLGDGIL